MPKISTYPPMSALGGTELILGDQGGITSVGTSNQVLAFVRGKITGQDSSNGLVATDSGTANTYVLTSTQPVSTLATGLLVQFVPLNTNTGASTVNVDGTGVKSIVNQYGKALTGGEISVPIWLQYTGSVWQIVGDGPTPDKARTAAEISAAIMPTNFTYEVEPYYIKRYGAKFDGSTDDTAAFNSAISVCAQAVGGATGCVGQLSTGYAVVSSQITLPNRVTLRGQNKLGSVVQAKVGHPGPYVFHAVNGTSSMFDSRLEQLSIDCNNIANLGGVLSDAWQENCGLRGCLIFDIGANGIGLQIQNGFGGAATLDVSNTEIFGGTSGSNSIGIQCEKTSSTGAQFLLMLRTVAFSGGSTANPFLKAINMVAENLVAHGLHIEFATHGVYLNGAGTHSLIGITGSNSVTNLITLDPAFTGTAKIIGCNRNGGTTLVNDLRVEQIALVGAITGGSLYTNGTYTAVPLTGGSGTNATGTITVSGGSVTAVSIINPGTNYAVGDTLSAAAANIGGTGSGFSIPVTQIFTGVGQLGGDYSELTLGPPANGAVGPILNYGFRSPAGVMAWGVFDGTVAGTNPCTASQNVSSVQRTGVGRYTVTLAATAASLSTIIPVATCNSPLLTVACAQIGRASFTILIDTATTGVATDNSGVTFMVAGL